MGGSSALRRATWRGLALLVGLWAASDARAETLAEQVNRAIERGTASVRKYLSADGQGTTGRHEEYPLGDTALLVLALVKSGVSPDDPQVAKAVEWMRTQPVDKTYSASVWILVLDALQDRRNAPQIQAAAKWIEERMDAGSGLWAYPDGDTDLSNTQYAVLGLWTAERHGHRAKPETWARVLEGVTGSQAPSGGFTYRVGDDENGGMTVGALTALALGIERVPESEKRWKDVRRAAQAAADRGWAYLERLFRVDANPHGPRGATSGWVEYYLYGVERLAALTGRQRIAGRDWYAEGARSLLARQCDDGSWGEPWNTCFALLFLRRATFTSMGGTAKAAEGDAVAPPPPRPVQPSMDVRWIRRWLVLGPVENPKDELFDEPPFPVERAAPSPGSSSGRWRWNVVESRENFVHLGDPARPTERSVAWAFTYLHVAADTDAVLRFGNDDGVRVLLDGAPVFSSHTHSHDEWDDNVVPLRLAAGTRRLILQVENWGSRHGFWIRIARPDGKACADVWPSLREDGADRAASVRAQPDLFPEEDLLRHLPRDGNLELSFATEKHLDRVGMTGDQSGYPRWAARPEESDTRRAPPGAAGLLGLHAEDGDRPMRVYWRVGVPAKAPRLRIRAAGTVNDPGNSDGLLRARVFDGEWKEVLAEVVGGGEASAPAPWRWIEGDLAPWAGREIVLAIEAASGGRHAWHLEDVWIDTVEIRCER